MKFIRPAASAAIMLAILTVSCARVHRPAAPISPANASASPSKSSMADKEALKKMLEREIEPLSPVPFSTPDGVSGRVEAVQAPIIKKEGEYQELTFSIGTQQPVYCALYPERIDPASTIWNVVKSIPKNLTVFSVKPVEVTAVEGSPLLVVELGYLADSAKGKLLGQLMVAVYPHPTHSLYCRHDEPGYSKSFERIIKGLAESLQSEAADDRANARFAEVDIVRISSVPVGFSERAIWGREGGGRMVATYATMLLNRSQSEFVAMDQVTVEEVDGEGLLSGGSYVDVVNGEVELKSTVAREKDGKTYRYDAQKSGKALQGDFVAEGGLATDLWFARQFDARHGYGPKEPVARHQYSRENPTAAVEMRYVKKLATPRGIETTFGPMKIDGELDDDGLILSAEMPMGQVAVKVERIWSRGSPWR